MSSMMNPKLEINDCIVWKDNIGYLPGCSLKFTRDDDGGLMLLDEADHLESLRKRQKLLKDQVFNDNPTDYDVSVCLRCMKSDFKENLVKNNKYCKECASIDPHLYKLFKSLSSQSGLKCDHDVAKAQAMLKQKLSNDYTFFNEFKWDEYLRKYDLLAISPELFLPEQNYPTKQNGFKVGMKLEGVDPSRPSKFCVLTIVETQGFRIRLHFDGYSKRFDFWLNADSPFIFPVGFCQKTGRKLEHPPGMKSFDWKNYLQKTESEAAPEDLFAIYSNPSKPSDTAGFKKNFKLEAVDIANSELICVATIKDVLDKHILIHFDGWDDSFDYWTSIYSTLIHPINWCKSKRGKSLTAPKDYKKDFKKEFVWEDYLRDTNSESVPEQVFNDILEKTPKSTINFWKPGLRLEAVDRRNPHLIRVASFVSKTTYSVKIHYDGWDECYDCVFEEDSPDLHPINWCQETNHPLEPPPNKYFVKLNTLCPISCCNGFGHVKWYKYKSHSQEIDCPYSDAYYEPESIDKYELNESCLPSEDEQDDGKNPKSNLYPELLQSKICPYQLKMIKENYLEMKKSHKSTESLRHLMDYMNSFDFKPLDIVEFDPTGIANIIEKLTKDGETANVFKQEKIDGISFLSLKQEDVRERLKIKLNYAVKIVSLIFFILKLIFKDGF